MTVAKNTLSTLTAVGENSGIVSLEGLFNFLLGGTFDGTYVLLKRFNDRNAIGVQDGGASGTVFTDSTAIDFVADELIGAWIRNDDDDSYGPITDNNTTTVTATLIGGTTTAWADGDTASIWEVHGTYTTPQVITIEEPEAGTDYVLICTVYSSGTPRVRISQ
jgi:hypothetical protein